MTPTNEPQTSDWGSTLAIGISLGMIFGLLLDQIGLGLATGLALATLANAYREKRQQIPRATAALAISAAAVLVILALWLLTALGLI